MELRFTPRLAATPLLLALLAVVAGATSGLAQGIQDSLWVTNGDVRGIIRSGDKLYVAGNFTHVGPATGGCVPLDATTGLLPGSFPRVAGTVYAIAPDGSGGWFIGGDFTAVSGQPRAYGAHVLSDLSLAAWDAQANNIVRAVVVSGTKVIMGGDFTSIGGQARNMIAALDATTGSATAWNPNAAGAVRALALNNNTVYVGGAFSSIGGASRNFLAQVDLTTGAATAWNPDGSGTIDAIVVGSSSVYVGGSFSLIGGMTRNNIVALDGTTGAVSGWNPNANGEVTTLAFNTPTVYAGGSFTNIGGQPRNRIAALNVVGGAATSWNPNANTTVNALLLSGGKVYAGGSFNLIGGAQRYSLAALDATTGAATSWDPHGDSNAVRCLGSSGSNIWAAGSFVTMNATYRSRLACLDATTGVPTAWDPSADQSVETMAMSGDTVYVGGSFTIVGGQFRSHIAQLDANGAATSWNPGANNSVYSLAIGPGRVYAGGLFTTIGGSSRNRIAALDPATGAPLGWDPNANGDVNVVKVDGTSVYLGGAFTAVGNLTKNRIAKVAVALPGNPSGWNPNANGAVYTIALSGTTVYTGGGFTTIGGAARSGLAALDASTGVATSWNPSPAGGALGLLVDGTRLYVGGSFSTIAAASRSNVAAFDIPSGALTAWDPSTNNVTGAFCVSGSRVYAGGIFSKVHNTSRSGLVALQAQPEIYAVQPSSGGNNGPVTVTVTGRFLASGASLKLQRSGQTPIGATQITVASDGTSMVGTCNLAGAVTGGWDLVVTNPDLQQATLASGFTINALQAPQLQLALIGPEPIRASYPTAFDLVIENPGNVDALDVPVWITGIPNSATLGLGFTLSPPPVGVGEPDWSQVPRMLGTANGQVLSFVIPRVPPGSTTRRFTLNVPASVPQFQLGAAITQAWTANATFLSCLSGPAVIQNAGCTGPYLTSINAYLAANPQLDAMSGMGIWAKDAWQCEGSSTLAQAGAKAGLIVGYLEAWIESGPPPSGCEDSFLPVWRPTRTVHVVSSIDPNDKLSPPGPISTTQAIPYSIRFENLAQATAAARQVTVVDQLATSLDLNSFSLDAIDLFGTVHLLPAPGARSYTHDVDLGQNNLMVRVSASLDLPSRQITWLFTTLDKTTQQPPANPLLGFLPPNTAPPQGEGSVLFTIRSLASTPNGTAIQNSALLNFDGSTQTTPVVANTLDSGAPASNVLSLGTPISSSSFPVSWTATGAPADLRDFTIYVSEDGTPYQAWKLNTTTTSGTYVPRPGGHTYYFYSVARDQSGNIESAPASPDAQTQSTTAVEDGVPSALALIGARPNPAHGSLRIAFALPSAAPATLELIDIAGRRVARRDVASLGPGHHELALGDPRLKAGLYFLRLTQAGQVLTARVVLMR